MGKSTVLNGCFSVRTPLVLPLRVAQGQDDTTEDGDRGAGRASWPIIRPSGRCRQPIRLWVLGWRFGLPHSQIAVCRKDARRPGRSAPPARGRSGRSSRRRHGGAPGDRRRDRAPGRWPRRGCEGGFALQLEVGGEGAQAVHLVAHLAGRGLRGPARGLVLGGIRSTRVVSSVSRAVPAEASLCLFRRVSSARRVLGQRIRGIGEDPFERQLCRRSSSAMAGSIRVAEEARQRPAC